MVGVGGTPTGFPSPCLCSQNSKFWQRGSHWPNAHLLVWGRAGHLAYCLPDTHSKEEQFSKGSQEAIGGIAKKKEKSASSMSGF